MDFRSPVLSPDIDISIPKSWSSILGTQHPTLLLASFRYHIVKCTIAIWMTWLGMRMLWVLSLAQERLGGWIKAVSQRLFFTMIKSLLRHWKSTETSLLLTWYISQYHKAYAGSWEGAFWSWRLRLSHCSWPRAQMMGSSPTCQLSESRNFQTQCS